MLTGLLFLLSFFYLGFVTPTWQLLGPKALRGCVVSGAGDLIPLFEAGLTGKVS